MINRSLLAIALLAVQAQPKPLTPIEQERAWNVVKMALPDAARSCVREIMRNNRGEGVVIRCGAPDPDPLAPTPMVFVVVDGKAYAASLVAGALTDLPDMSASDEIRRRTGFAHFVEVTQRKDQRGLVTGWKYYHYDPRPGVCIDTHAAPASAFVPAQQPRELPEQVVTRKLEQTLRAIEGRGRIIVGPNATMGCTLRIDEVKVEQHGDDAFATSVTLHVLERGKEAYREHLRRDGEEVAETGEELASDLVGFLRSNYDKLTTLGATKG